MFRHVNKFQQSGSTLLVCAVKSGKKSWRKATTVEKTLYLKEKARLEKAAAQKIVDDANAEAQRIIKAAQVAAAKTKAELQAAADKAAAKAATAKAKTTTITCVKGKLIKKVTAVNPTCPAGYKKK
jgi:cell division septum initiation protein DivIVA